MTPIGALSKAEDASSDCAMNSVSALKSQLSRYVSRSLSAAQQQDVEQRCKETVVMQGHQSERMYGKEQKATRSPDVEAHVRQVPRGGFAGLGAEKALQRGQHQRTCGAH